MKNKKLDWFFKYIVNTIVLIILLTLAYKSLKYENKFYKVAEGWAAITEDKVSDDNARLLTMVEHKNL